MQIEIERLGTADRDAAVEVLAAAFHDYPVMRYVIGNSCADYETQLRHLIGFYTDKRFVSDWPALGIRRDGDLVAVTLVSRPTGGNPERLAALLTDLRSSLGEAAYQRMQRFERTSDANEPPGPHFFVGMLGTRPGHQGMGYGKALLERVKDLAIADGATGVCLSTEDPANVPLYVHLGFEVMTEADVDELHTWCLMWRKPSG